MILFNFCFRKGMEMMKMVCSIIPLVLSLILSGVAASEGIVGYKQPANCARLECPAYDVVESRTEFEIRLYKNAGWIAFPVPDGRSYLDASTRGFFRLFAYIHGKNKGHVQINMTAPVLVDVPKFPSAEDEASANASSPSYGVYFYLPQKYQKDPPLPTADLSRPVDLPPYKLAAVKRFGGVMTDINTAQQAAALKDSLRGTYWDAAISGKFYTVAGYNGPTELTDRVNEVIFWFIKLD